MYSVIASEWPDCRRGLEERLARSAAARRAGDEVSALQALDEAAEIVATARAAFDPLSGLHLVVPRDPRTGALRTLEAFRRDLDGLERAIAEERARVRANAEGRSLGRANEEGRPLGRANAEGRSLGRANEEGRPLGRPSMLLRE